MESLSVPFQFAATFLVAAAAFGAAWAALRRSVFSPPRRGAPLVFSLGWLCLGVAEILKGLYLAETESTVLLIALRASGYTLVALTLLSPRRSSATSALITPVAPSAHLVPGTIGLIGGFLALRSRIEGRLRMSAALICFGLAEIFMGLGDTTSEQISGLWIASQTLWLAGGIFLGGWVWRALSGSIQIRFIAAFVVLLLAVVIAISSAMTQIFAANLTTESLREAAREGELQKGRLIDQVSVAVRDAGQIARADEVRRLVSERSPLLVESARLLQAPGGLFEQADFLTFLSTEGALLAFSATSAPSPDGIAGEPHIDEADAVSLAGTDVASSALAGVEAGSLDAIGASKIGVIGAFSVLNPPGVDPPGAPQGIAGAVVLGQIIDADYLNALRAGGRQHFSLIAENSIVASTVDRPEAILRDDIAGVFERGESPARETAIEGVQYFSSYVPLERSDGRIVGALVISRPSDVLALTQRNVGQTLFGLGLVAATLAIFLAYLFGSRISRPILDLRRAAERVRGGDLEARVDAGGADEVGALGEAFNEMTSSISQLTGDLRNSAERLRTVLYSMTDGVISVDREGKVVTINMEAERILRVTERKAVGKNVDQILSIADETGKPLSPPIYRLRAGAVRGLVGDSGEGTPVSVTSAQIRDENGEVEGAVAVIRDLTPEVAVEKMKTEFLSNISHELRTPLTPIKGWADLLLRKKVPRPQQTKFLQGIVSSTRRLERIVEMLVDVSSIEAGRLVPRTSPVDLDVATAELVAKWKRDYPSHRFERRGFGTLPLLEADERLLPRAIDELVDNAVKFSPKGGSVAVTAEVERSANGPVALISVKDRGMGISREQLEEMFGDFVQADASATREVGGLGLGLGYVRRIAEGHGGRLTADSEPGKGSVFTIELPVAGRGRGTSRAKGTKPAASRNRPKGPISRKRGK